MSFIINFLHSSVEWQNWGFNIQTFGAAGTLFFTAFQIYGAWEQRKKIKQKKSGDSVSKSFFIFTACYFFAFLIYGLDGRKMAVILNGLFLGPIYLLVLLKLLEYEKLNKKEILVAAVSAATIPLMMILKNTGKEILLGGLLAGLTLFGIMMFLEMKQSKKRGAISLNFLLVALATNIFWLIYAVAISNSQLIIANCASIMIFSSMIFLYWKYGADKSKN